MNAYIQHDENTVRELIKMRYRLFCSAQGYIITIFGLVLLIYGFFGGAGQTMTFCCLLAGAMALTGSDVPARRTASSAVAALKGDFPLMHYELGDRVISVTTDMKKGTSRESVQYGDIIRLARSKDYCYFFMKKKEAYMIDIRGLSQEKAGLLFGMLEEKTGLKWKKPFDFWTLSLPAIIKERVGSGSKRQR